MATIVPVLAPRAADFPDPKSLEKFMALGLQVVESALVAYGDTSPAQLFTVPAGTLVVDLIVEITEVFNGTGAALTIGDGTDADGFMDATQAAVTVLGYKSIKQDTQPFSGGKEYTAEDTIDAVITPGTAPTTGKFRCFLIYRSKTDKYQP